eukprot:1148892-Pelagomonas_calceolata.AAC.5
MVLGERLKGCSVWSVSLASLAADCGRDEQQLSLPVLGGAVLKTGNFFFITVLRGQGDDPAVGEHKYSPHCDQIR